MRSVAQWECLRSPASAVRRLWLGKLPSLHGVHHLIRVLPNRRVDMRRIRSSLHLRTHSHPPSSLRGASHSWCRSTHRHSTKHRGSTRQCRHRSHSPFKQESQSLSKQKPNCPFNRKPAPPKKNQTTLPSTKSISPSTQESALLKKNQAVLPNNNWQALSINQLRIINDQPSETRC